jgi:RNA polymerase sigma factor (sigma-70 family)
MGRGGSSNEPGVRAGSRTEPEQGTDADGALLLQSRTNATAFGEFYDRTCPAVLAFFYRRTACPHTSADLTAETFAEALASLRRFDPSRGTGRGWLFGIAGNQYRQWLRRGRVSDGARRKLGVQPVDLRESEIDRIETLVDFAPLRVVLQDALLTLPEPMRDAVILRVGFELPYPEVADRLGCTVNNARVRVSRALDRLTLALESSA